ncbi:unnamed protein product [Rhizoctonia solani]|uniref:Uncharacterized protein n=1 Tax=Rhizoctonia solani TaxID=456999 RepID=A0A8H3B3Z8_9AGAM|nr:unnamed protein product [Rhizoctonia solani]
MSTTLSDHSREGSQPSSPPRDNRRKQRRFTDDHDDHDDDQTPPAKHPNIIFVNPKRKTADEYGVAARLITRLYGPNWEPCDVVNAGITLLILDDQDEVDAAIASASEK